MAATNQTSNYGLPQWLGSDKLERTDMNTAFAEIDDNLNLVQSDVAAIDSLLNSDVLIKRGVTPANFNDAVNPGVYTYGASGYTNAPRSGYGGILVVFATTNNSWRAQLCFDHDNLYYRLLYSGAWRQWRLISAQAL